MVQMFEEFALVEPTVEPLVGETRVAGLSVEPENPDPTLVRCLNESVKRIREAKEAALRLRTVEDDKETSNS